MCPWSKGLQSHLQLSLSSISTYTCGVLKVLPNTALILKIVRGLPLSLLLVKDSRRPIQQRDVMHRLPEAGDRKDGDLSKLI